LKQRFFTIMWTVELFLLICACGTTSQSGPTLAPTQAATKPDCQKPAVVTPTSTPSDQAKALGFVGTKLATGSVAALPTGTLYINVVEIPQPAGNSITHRHTAGFVYVVDGTHTLAIQGGQTLTLNAGEAGFAGAGMAHSHTNPGTATSHWYIIALRQNTARTAPPLFPNEKVLYATPDLPTLTSGSYCETLRLTVVQPGGRSAAHMHSGLEVIFVLTGSFQLHTAGHTPVTVIQGQGAYILPNTPMQVINLGGLSRLLALVIWPQDQPFETDLSESP
jgi:quercetin dioxygenase-like cupin family protein